MARGLVLVDDAFADHVVDGRRCDLVTGLRSFLIASRYCIDDVLDLAADTRTQGHVVGPTANCLTCALLS